MALREDQVTAAILFLGNEKVVGRPPAEKEDFLRKKGLTGEEITEATRRYKLTEASAAAAWPDVASAAALGAAAPTPSVPSSSQAWAEGTTVQPSYGNQYPQAMPPPGMPPWAAMQMMQPLPVALPAGPSWVLALLAGLGGASLGGALAALWGVLQRQQGPGGVMSHIGYASPAQRNTGAAFEGGGSGGSADKGGADDMPLAGRAAYEELVELLRQQREEARETATYHAKVIRELQEQNKQLVGEMQKLVQQQMQQQKAQKAQPTELSATSLRQLAELLQPASNHAAPAVSIATPPSGPATATFVPGGGMVLGPAAAIAGGVHGPVVGGGALRDSLGAIAQSLQRLVNESATQTDAAKALQTLSMILQNLLSNPTSEKHRKVNTSSSRFKELLGQQSAAAELLRLAGFQYQEPNFTFIVPDQTAGGVANGGHMDAPARVRDLIQDAQRNLDATWAARNTAGGSSGDLSCADSAGARTPPQGAAPGADGPRVATGAPWFTAAGTLARSPAATPAPVAPAVAPEEPGGSERGGDGAEALAVAPAAGGGPSAGEPVMAPAAGGGPALGEPVMAHPAESPGEAGEPVMAHPAESPGPAIAHPAEADASPRGAAQHAHAPAQVMAPAAGGGPAPGEPVMAHPAESSPVFSGEHALGG